MSEYAIRQAKESDHTEISEAIYRWWDGRDLRKMVPRLFLIHFCDTSFVVEKEGKIAGFLIGFMSQAKEKEAYIHFAGVSKEERGRGIGRSLYIKFFDTCRKRARSVVNSCTSPVNKGSIAFHKRLGFEVFKSGYEADGVFVYKDYNRKGDDKVLFRKKL